MRSAQIDLVYFEGCPNATKARENLRAAIEQTGTQLAWSEWDLMADTTPERFRKHGSPTVLVDGRDVTGEGAEATAMACRSDGAPSVALIAESLA
ncbi:MAG: hypothetical protein L7S64_11095 [Longimicrobiales bacterium]|nr:hypothetical protein [Longimicrobiales bacterium]